MILSPQPYLTPLDDTFEIPVVYNNKEFLFKAQVLHMGYIQKISIDVNGDQVLLEKDDEENYRAVVADINSQDRIDKGLVKAIVDLMNSL